ncbi:hypothetical protein B9Z55_015107 [Caenorhabditis nigoni]|uniref:Peptidase S1 domain-containing protein n=1 Tax=Caenorhabditis nigoni TaxID=1611254 RepID=A0A2G5U8Q6_9PELO|nr:hypothetical protein B9Z55_015107 [Caenorhabditis nigoni]
MMNYCYQATCDYDDMMILELNENIQLDDYAYPACVSSERFFKTTKFQGLQVTGSYNDGRFIWISGEGVNVRPGDSGGSDIHYDNGRYYLVGVNSVSFDTGFNAGASSVFAHFNKICRYTGVC